MPTQLEYEFTSSDESEMDPTNTTSTNTDNYFDGDDDDDTDDLSSVESDFRLFGGTSSLSRKNDHGKNKDSDIEALFDSVSDDKFYCYSAMKNNKEKRKKKSKKQDGEEQWQQQQQPKQYQSTGMYSNYYCNGHHVNMDGDDDYDDDSASENDDDSSTIVQEEVDEGGDNEDLSLDERWAESSIESSIGLDEEDGEHTTNMEDIPLGGGGDIDDNDGDFYASASSFDSLSRGGSNDYIIEVNFSPPEKNRKMETHSGVSLDGSSCHSIKETLSIEAISEEEERENDFFDDDDGDDESEEDFFNGDNDAIVNGRDGEAGLPKDVDNGDKKKKKKTVAETHNGLPYYSGGATTSTGGEGIATQYERPTSRRRRSSVDSSNGKKNKTIEDYRRTRLQEIVDTPVEDPLMEEFLSRRKKKQSHQKRDSAMMSNPLSTLDRSINTILGSTDSLGRVVGKGQRLVKTKTQRRRTIDDPLMVRLANKKNAKQGHAAVGEGCRPTSATTGRARLASTTTTRSRRRPNNLDGARQAAKGVKERYLLNAQNVTSR